MSNTYPEYRSHLDPPLGPNVIVQPVPLMPMPDLDTGAARVGGALATAGAVTAQVGEHIFEAIDKTKTHEAMAGFAKDAAALDEKYREGNVNDGSRAEVKAELEAARGKYLGPILDPIRRSTAEQSMTITSLAVEKRVSNRSTAAMIDRNDSALTTLKDQAYVAHNNPDASSTERGAKTQSYLSALQRSVEAGTKSQQQADRDRAEFSWQVDSARAGQVLRASPTELTRQMADPAKNFPGITRPVEIENWRARAAQQEGELKVHAIQLQASKPDDPGQPIGTNMQRARDMKDELGLTEMQGLQADKVIEHEMRSRTAADRASVSDIASLDRVDNPVTNLAKEGIETNPAAWAQSKAKQQAAANLGDRAAAKQLYDMNMYEAVQPLIKDAWKLTPGQLEATIGAKKAQMATEGYQLNRGDQLMMMGLQAVRDKMQKAISTEPVTIGGDSGARYFSVKPIAWANAPNNVNEQAKMVERGQQADLVRRTVGGDGNPYTVQEAIGEKKRYEEGGPLQRFQQIEMLVSKMPRSEDGRNTVAKAAINQIAGGDFATDTYVDLVTRNPTLAKQVLTGFYAGKQHDTEPGKRNEIGAAIGELTGNEKIYQANAHDADKYAVALYTFRRGEQGLRTVEAREVQKAWQDVNGLVTTLNGRKVAVYPGGRDGPFVNAIQRISEDQIGAAGGAFYRDGAPATAADIRDRGQLRALKPGSTLYAVGVPQSDQFMPLQTAQGTPLVVDMSALSSEYRGAVGRTEFQGFLRKHAHELAVGAGERNPPLGREDRAAAAQRLEPGATPEFEEKLTKFFKTEFPNASERDIAAKVGAVVATEPSAVAARQRFLPDIADYPSFDPQAWDAAIESMPLSLNIEDRRPAADRRPSPRTPRIGQ